MDTDSVRGIDRRRLVEWGGLAAAVGYASGDGFATARDPVRFAEALRDGTVLDRPYADLLAGAKLLGPEPTTFDGYPMPVSIANGQWVFGRGGGGGG